MGAMVRGGDSKRKNLQPREKGRWVNTGGVTKKTISCKTCAGTGVIKQDCRHCKGGWVNNVQKCRHCWGSGQGPGKTCDGPCGGSGSYTG